MTALNTAGVLARPHFQILDLSMEGIGTLGEGLCSPWQIERLQQVIELRDIIERRYGKVVALRVVGDSMERADLLRGDIAFFASVQQIQPADGMVVMVKVDYYDPLIKLYRGGELVSLYRDHDVVERFMEAEEVRITGVMVYKLQDMVERYNRTVQPKGQGQ